jgi:hypothetical protein
LSAIRSKDRRRKLTRGSRALYAQKIEEAETAEGESLNIREQFTDSSKIHERLLQKVETFEEFKEIRSNFVKDSY